MLKPAPASLFRRVVICHLNPFYVTLPGSDLTRIDITVFALPKRADLAFVVVRPHTPAGK